MCFGGRKLKEEHIYQVQASDRTEAPVHGMGRQMQDIMNKKKIGKAANEF